MWTCFAIKKSVRSSFKFIIERHKKGPDTLGGYVNFGNAMCMIFLEGKGWTGIWGSVCSEVTSTARKVKGSPYTNLSRYDPIDIGINKR